MGSSSLPPGPSHAFPPPAPLRRRAVALLPASPADEPKLEPGTVELFNGKDLTGWGYKTKDKFESFDGKTEASDKRYSAKDGVLIVNPGKGTAQLWTAAKFPKDFELRLEFRAAVNADSGLFVRGPQLQVRDYLVAGPYKELKKYKPQDWNEIVVVVKGESRALHLQRRGAGGEDEGARDRPHRPGGRPRPDGVPQDPAERDQVVPTLNQGLKPLGVWHALTHAKGFIMRTVLLTVAALCAPSLASAADESPALKKGDKIVFLGDSITQGGVSPKGYVTLIKNTMAEKHKDLGVEVVGAGISGNKVPDLQKRLEKDVLAKKPTVVVIYIGINDVWHGETDPAKGTSKEKFEAGLKEIIGKIKDGGARVVLCTPTVIGEKKAGANKLDAKLDEYADISRAVAKATGSQLCDLRKAFVDHLAKNNDGDKESGILTTDRVHLNEAGNKLVADTILATIDK